MEKKKYYAIKTSMAFETTVLVPVDSVEDLEEAIDLVDYYLETGAINLFDEEADFVTKVADNTDENGVREYTEEYAASYHIIGEEE